MWMRFVSLYAKRFSKFQANEPGIRRQIHCLIKRSHPAIRHAPGVHKTSAVSCKLTRHFPLRARAFDLVFRHVQSRRPV
jgi:hypothetical protein